jgi:serine/threonine protein kinase
MKGLKLDISIRDDEFQGMEDTYRREGLTVGSDYMRIHGVDFDMEVRYSDLIMGRRIGQGACSSVNIAKHSETGEMFAVKMFNVYDENQSKQLIKEICMLSVVKCDSLISLKGAFHDEGSIGIIIEYMDRGSLEFMLEEEINVNEQVMAAIIYQILWGLGYLHYDNRLHRDIKPGNILINAKGEVKLSDFGISRSLDNSSAMSRTSVGSFRYMSPERLLGDHYDTSGDIWSVGIMMLQLWTKKYPFEDNISTPIDLLTELEGLQLDSLLRIYNFPRLMGHVVINMMAPDPVDRANCMELLEYRWFQESGVCNILDAQQIVEKWLYYSEKKAADLWMKKNDKGNDKRTTDGGNSRIKGGGSEEPPHKISPQAQADSRHKYYEKDYYHSDYVERNTSKFTESQEMENAEMEYRLSDHTIYDSFHSTKESAYEDDFEDDIDDRIPKNGCNLKNSLKTIEQKPYRVDISDRKLVTQKMIDERNRDNGKSNIASRYK